jgi:hypothetical protein
MLKRLSPRILADDPRRRLAFTAACVLATLAVAQFIVPALTRSAVATTLTASADTYSTELSPDLVTGGYDFLKVKGVPLRSSYLRFDVDRAIPNVKRATLRVYSTERNDWRVDVRYVADSGWGENDLTFNNAPWTGPIVGHAPVITARGWVEVDVTDVLQHDSVISHGGKLTLALTTSADAYIGDINNDEDHKAAGLFASRETATPPQLTIEGGVSTPNPTTTAAPTTTVPPTTTAPPPTTTAPPPTTTTPTTTPPAPGGALHVAAVGDIQPPGTSSNSQATAALAARADFILGLGDYQYQDGTMSDYNAYFDRSWGPNVAKMYPVLAPTHDQDWQAGDTLNYWNGGGASGVRAPVRLQALTPYSFTRGGWHFVALPDACYRVSGCDGNAITTWLANDLAAHPTPCTVAYFHQAYFTSAAEHDPFDAVQPWVKVLVDHRVDILLQGHNHNYERFAPQNEARGADPNGIQAFVVGTGGIGFYAFRGLAPNSVTRQADTFGVLDLSLGNGSYSWSFARAAGGNYSDTGSMACR